MRENCTLRSFMFILFVYSTHKNIHDGVGLDRNVHTTLSKDKLL